MIRFKERIRGKFWMILLCLLATNGYKFSFAHTLPNHDNKAHQQQHTVEGKMIVKSAGHAIKMTTARNEQGDLKERIQSDKRLGLVKEKAIELIKKGFTAGDGYSEVWIRDYNTFITVASLVHTTESTKENLRVFFRLQGDDGNIIDGFVPKEKAISSKIGYEYIHSDLEPNYAGHKNTVETDQESSLIQAVYKYVQATGDNDFLEESIAGVSIKRRMGLALDFLMKHRYNKRYGLLWGATTADWGDVQP